MGRVDGGRMRQFFFFNASLFSMKKEAPESEDREANSQLSRWESEFLGKHNRRTR